MLGTASSVTTNKLLMNKWMLTLFDERKQVGYSRSLSCSDFNILGDLGADSRGEGKSKWAEK